jgi:two-component system OmpR family sensor kinase
LARRIRRLAENDMDIETGGIERLDEFGDMARAIVVFRNNAIELEQSQRALAEKLAHEQQLTELQRNFVSMTSHEFRTPLTIIDGQAQRLINAGDRLTPEDIAQRARNVRTAVTRMTSVIDNLIDASRLMDSPAALFFRPTEFDLAALLQEICHSHRDLAPKARITEHPSAAMMPIVGDQKLLFQVFHNIISNAVKYSPDSAVVRVAFRIVDEEAVVTVEDQGLGIPRADRERLFERYYRGSNVAGIVGSGIGLYLVKTVVDLHRGRVLLESEEGQGARFTVRLPVSQEANDAAAAKAATPEARPLNAALS